jgi:hypothetical protein
MVTPSMSYKENWLQGGTKCTRISEGTLTMMRARQWGRRWGWIEKWWGGKAVRTQNLQVRRSGRGKDNCEKSSPTLLVGGDTTELIKGMMDTRDT